MQNIAFKYVDKEKRYQVMRECSLIEEGEVKMVKMANLCILACKHVNGVAELHTEILKNNIFYQMNQEFPNKIVNITNGVTPRRWIHCANPELSALYSAYLKEDKWLCDLNLIRALEKFIDDPEFTTKWQDIKLQNKRNLKQFV